MTAAHLHSIAVYLTFATIATGLAVLARPQEPLAADESVWRKYPSYLAMNGVMLGAIWLPTAWHAWTALVLLVAVACGLEALGTLRRVSGWNLRLGMALAGTAYLCVTLYALHATRSFDSAGHHAAFLYMVVAANDAYAQILGQRFGRHQLAARVSPNKTAEGTLGGWGAATAIGAALAPILGWTWLFGGGVALACAGAGTLGDLAASAWKRAAGVRSFGSTLGAHGGVLDRVDGWLLAALAFYAARVTWAP